MEGRGPERDLTAEYPNRLWAERPSRLAPRWATLALLALVCFVPRAWQATRWNILWDDTLVYLRSAEDLERGNLFSAFEELNFNVYPIILWGLRSTGWDWTTSGEWWSVLMATVAVWPLYGWIRRQFDDTVALVSCLLYAVHPLLIAFAPLIIRDATFWFLFNLTLYLTWRAVTEIRWSWYLAAGAALTLSVHTRSEGWLLLVPLAVWSLGRFAAVGTVMQGESMPSDGLPGKLLAFARRPRVRLVLGVFSCLAILPLATAAVNLTWLRDCPRWDLIRPMHKQMAMAYVRSLRASGSNEGNPVSPPARAETILPLSPNPSGIAPTVSSLGPPALQPTPLPPPSPPPVPAAPSAWTITRKLLIRVVKGYSYVFALLGLVGAFRAWRVYLRLEHQAVLLMGMSFLAIIWIRYTQANIDLRYFLPMVMASLPWIALGLLAVEQAILARFAPDQMGTGTVRQSDSSGFQAGRSGPVSMISQPRRMALTAGLVLLVGLLSLPSLRLNVPGMHSQAALGKWIEARLGPRQKITPSIHKLQLLEYYSQGSLLEYFNPDDYRNGALPPAIQTAQPDVVVFWLSKQRESCLAVARAMAATPGVAYRQMSREQLPPECGNMLVFLRRDKLDRLAQRISR